MHSILDMGTVRAYTWRTIELLHTLLSEYSPAWKSTALYQSIGSYFHPEEYLLAYKAYALERNIITPYKEPASGQSPNAAFNYALSIPRVKIEHAFGVLKARWSTLYEMPIRIGADREEGHRRVHNWTMACLVLHNILHSMKDDETWLQAQVKRQEALEIRNNRLEEQLEGSNAEAKQAGITRRTELRNLVNLLQPRNQA